MFRVILILLLASPAFGDYQSTILADSPVFYCRLGESSGITADDIGSGNNDGTYTPNSAGSWTGGTLGTAGLLTGDGNTAITPNGSSGYVNVTDAANIRYTSSQAITVEAWFSSSNLTGVHTILSKWDTTNEREWIVYSNGTTLTVGVNGESTEITTTITTSTTYHLVLTLSTAGASELWLNGVSKGTGSATSFRTTPNETLRIGQNSNINYFAGIIDEVAVYNSVLNSTQIAAHYAAGTSSGSNIPVIIHHMRTQGYALFNGSPVPRRWEVTCVPPGVLFFGTHGIVPPFTGATIAEWSGELDQAPPDVINLGTKRTYFAYRDNMTELIECCGGPGVPYPADRCDGWDFDLDGDVDQADFGHVQSLVGL